MRRMRMRLAAAAVLSAALCSRALAFDLRFMVEWETKARLHFSVRGPDGRMYSEARDEPEGRVGARRLAVTVRNASHGAYTCVCFVADDRGVAETPVRFEANLSEPVFRWQDAKVVLRGAQRVARAFEVPGPPPPKEPRATVSAWWDTDADIALAVKDPTVANPTQSYRFAQRDRQWGGGAETVLIPRGSPKPFTVLCSCHKGPRGATPAVTTVTIDVKIDGKLTRTFKLNVPLDGNARQKIEIPPRPAGPGKPLRIYLQWPHNADVGGLAAVVTDPQGNKHTRLSQSQHGERYIGVESATPGKYTVVLKAANPKEVPVSIRAQWEDDPREPVADFRVTVGGFATHTFDTRALETQIGEQKPRFVVFKIFVPAPTDAASKRRPQKGEKETDKAFEARLRQFADALQDSDFQFNPIPMEAMALPCRFAQDGLKRYPNTMWESSRKYACRFQFEAKDAKTGQRTRQNVTVLLEAAGVFTSQEAAEENYAVLTSGDNITKWIDFIREDGTVEATSEDPRAKGETGILGPITDGWTAQDRKQAIVFGRELAAMHISCFVATAAYRDPRAPQLRVLRGFRDEVLLRSRAGAHLVELYYTHGPRWARVVQADPELAGMVRWALDRVVLWIQRTDLDDPAARRAVDAFATCADRTLSLFLRDADASLLHRAFVTRGRAARAAPSSPSGPGSRRVPRR